MNKNRKRSIIIILSIIIVSVLVFQFFNKPKQPHLTVIGRLQMTDGLGRQTAELVDAVRNDISVGVKATDKNKTGLSPEIREMLKKKHVPMGKVIVYEDCLGEDGMSFKSVIKDPKNEKSIRIAYSMFESSLIPPSWAAALNTYFDAVAVPDQFLIEVYKNSGVTIPIFELPLGLNLDPFLNAPLKTEKKSPLVFANLSSIVSRKNQLKLVQAFHTAFGNSPDVKLRLNGRSGDPQYIEAIKNEIRALGLSNVEFTQIEMEKELYFKTFQTIDCYVSLSSGEGFSIQPREAMALGIPVIITDSTGQSTICKSFLGRAIPSPNPVPAFYHYYNNHYGLFYDCKTEDVVQALKDVHQNYDTYLKQGSVAREWVKQYSYSQLKPFYLGLIKPKKIILGDINKITLDCLFTNSEELCKKFSQLLEIPYEKI